MNSNDLQIVGTRICCNLNALWKGNRCASIQELIRIQCTMHTAVIWIHSINEFKFRWKAKGVAGKYAKPNGRWILGFSNYTSRFRHSQWLISEYTVCVCVMCVSLCVCASASVCARPCAPVCVMSLSLCVCLLGQVYFTPVGVEETPPSCSKNSKFGFPSIFGAAPFFWRS